MTDLPALSEVALDGLELLLQKFGVLSMLRHHGAASGCCIVGTTACSCQDRHLSWTCNECGNTTYGPALGPDCRVLHGAARVRSLTGQQRVPQLA
jgi:hypothetical protein